MLMDVEEKVNHIRDMMYLLQNLVTQPQVIEMERRNRKEYEDYVTDFSGEFGKKYPSLLSLIMDRKDTAIAEIILKNNVDQARGLIDADKKEELNGKLVGDAMYEFK